MYLTYQIFQPLNLTSTPKSTWKSTFNKGCFRHSNVEHKRSSHNARQRKNRGRREREGDLHENHFWWHRTSAQEHLHLSLIRLVPRPSSDRLCLPYTILSRKMNRSARRVEAAALRRLGHDTPSRRFSTSPRPEDRRESASFHVSDTRHPRNPVFRISPLSVFVVIKSVNQWLDDEIWKRVA